MIAVRTLRYPNVPTMLRGVTELRRAGVTPRGLLFLAVDDAGATHLGVPANVDEVEKIKVGHKLSLAWEETAARLYYFDSVHRLGDKLVLFNGDRRLGNCATAVEVAVVISMFLKASSAKNVFFGCKPHQPGSWLARNEDDSTALHQHGYVEVVPAPQGLIARRTLDEHLFFLPAADDGSFPFLDSWLEIYSSPLGNILMLERRIVGNRLVLTCERGLVEVNVSALPLVRELRRVELRGGFGVVGRVDGGSFAVTAGKVEPWGLDEIKPALLIGAEGTTLSELAAALSHGRRQQAQEELGSQP
jgi:hypothetical protein